MRSLPALIVIAILVAVAVFVADQPGRVSILWQGWRIETSVAVLILGALAFAVAAAITFGLLRRLIGAPRALLRARREGRRRDGYRALTQGMVAVAAGDAEEAQRYARKADILLAEPPLTLLLSAQAAQLKGDEDAARKYFAAMLNRPETEFLGLRGLLTQALRRGEETAALRLAERAHTMRPKTPWVLTNLLELQVKAGEWQNAQATLAEAVKFKVLPAAAGRHHQAALLLARSRAAEDDDAAALSLAREAQDLAPDFAPAAARRAQLLQRAGNRNKAAKAIEAAWRRAPHPLLAETYAALFAEEPPLSRVKRAERLAALNADHWESRLAVAQAALAAQLWGEARRQLAATVAPGEAGNESSGGEARPSARICRLMAALEEAEHGDGTAARSWLARAAEAPADPVWICNSCGAESRDWQPLCPRCRAFDSLTWQIPTRAVPALAEYPADRPAALLTAAPAPAGGEKAARWPPAAAPAAFVGSGAPVDAGRG